MTALAERLAALGLPAAQPLPLPRHHLPALAAGDLLFVSNQYPMRDGRLVWSGRVGAERTLAEARTAAQLAAIALLACIEREAGSLLAVERIVRLEGQVAGAPGFDAHEQVMDAASELVEAVLRLGTGHARCTWAAERLPADATVTLAGVVALRPAAAPPSHDD